MLTTLPTPPLEILTTRESPPRQRIASRYIRDDWHRRQQDLLVPPTLSSSVVAEALGVCPSTVNRWRTAVHPIPLYQYFSLLRLTGNIDLLQSYVLGHSLVLLRRPHPGHDQTAIQAMATITIRMGQLLQVAAQKKPLTKKQQAEVHHLINQAEAELEALRQILTESASHQEEEEQR